MKSLSLKMDDVVFNDTERMLAKLNKPRNRYINDAVAFYYEDCDIMIDQIRAINNKRLT